MVEVAVIGAAGYAGIEAVRLVLGHPRLRLALATSAADAGKPGGVGLPRARRSDRTLEFTAPDVDAIASAASVALLAVPHTAALDLVPALLERGVTVIDMSADYRLKDPLVYEAWYGAAHTSPELLGVGGLRAAGARPVGAVRCQARRVPRLLSDRDHSGGAARARGRASSRHATSWSTPSPGVSGAGRSASAGTHYVTVNEAVQPVQGRLASPHPRDRAGALGCRRQRALGHLHAAPRSDVARAARRPSTSTSRPTSPRRRRSSSTAAAITRSRSCTCTMRGPCHRPPRFGAPTARRSASRSTAGPTRSWQHVRSTTSARARPDRPCSASTPFSGIPRRKGSTDPGRSSSARSLARRRRRRLVTNRPPTTARSAT